MKTIIASEHSVKFIKGLSQRYCEVDRTNVKFAAKRFDNVEQAQAFINQYADRGYGLSSNEGFTFINVRK